MCLPSTTLLLYRFLISQTMGWAEGHDIVIKLTLIALVIKKAIHVSPTICFLQCVMLTFLLRRQTLCQKLQIQVTYCMPNLAVLSLILLKDTQAVLI